MEQEQDQDPVVPRADDPEDEMPEGAEGGVATVPAADAALPGVFIAPARLHARTASTDTLASGRRTRSATTGAGHESLHSVIETLKSLKKSKSGYQSAVTKILKKAEHSLLGKCNFMTCQEILTNLKSAFTKYSTSANQLIEYVTDNVVDQLPSINADVKGFTTNYDEMVIRLTEYLGSCGTRRSVHASSISSKKSSEHASSISSKKSSHASRASNISKISVNSVRHAQIQLEVSKKSHAIQSEILRLQHEQELLELEAIIDAATPHKVLGSNVERELPKTSHNIPVNPDGFLTKNDPQFSKAATPPAATLQQQVAPPSPPPADTAAQRGAASSTPKCAAGASHHQQGAACSGLDANAPPFLPSPRAAGLQGGEHQSSPYKYRHATFANIGSHPPNVTPRSNSESGSVNQLPYQSVPPHEDVGKSLAGKQAPMQGPGSGPAVYTSQPIVQGNDHLRDLAMYFRSKAELPETEPLKFSGKSEDFTAFIVHFDSNVAPFCHSQSSAFNQLYQACDDVSRQYIDLYREYETDGYIRARETLIGIYGSAHNIEAHCLTSLIDGKPAVLEEYNLQQWLIFHSAMRKCQNALLRWDRAARLDSSDTLRAVVCRMPFHPRRRWNTRVSWIRSRDNRDENFSDLVTFIGEHIDSINTEYGRDLAETMAKGRRKESVAPVTMVTTSTQKDANGKGKKAKDSPDPSLVTTTAATPAPAAGAGQKKHPNEAASSPKKSPSQCFACEDPSHTIFKCDKFRKMDPSQRRAIMAKLDKCVNCFRDNSKHNDGCSTASRCNVGECAERKPHHRAFCLLGWPLGRAKDTTASGAAAAVTIATVPDVLYVGSKVQCVMLSVRTATGSLIQVPCLVDSCSSFAFATKSLADELGIERSKGEITVGSISSSMTLNGDFINPEVSSLCGSFSFVIPSVGVLESLPASARHIFTRKDKAFWPHLDSIPTDSLPPDGFCPQLLVGTATTPAFRILEQLVKEGDWNAPIGMRSPLGWSVLGPAAQDTKLNAAPSLLLTPQPSHDEDELYECLESMYKLDFPERVYEAKLAPSASDKKAMEIVENSIKLVDGHFSIDLPWRRSPLELPFNFHYALKRANVLRAKMAKDESIKIPILSKFEDYLKKGFFEEVGPLSAASRVPIDGVINHYIPMHVVVTPEKVRLVGDAAAKTPDAAGKRVCINDFLHRGPCDGPTLIGCALRFRLKQIAVVSDITDMFQNVTAPEKDRDALKIIFFKGENLELHVYRATCHLFGLKSSNFTASRALLHCALDFAHEHRAESVELVKNNFSVDDLLANFDSVEEASDIILSDLPKMVGKAGFSMHKIQSNSAEFMDCVPVELRAKPKVKDLFQYSGPEPPSRVLGTKWDTAVDHLLYPLCPSVSEGPLCPRRLLSLIARIYDPTGHVSPVILTLRTVLQRAISEKLTWDQTFEDSKVVAWLEQASEVTTPSTVRCVIPPCEIESYQFHTLVDASRYAYSVAIYLRVKSILGEIHTNLLFGKCRVAPLKPKRTVVMLELMAMALGAKLWQLVWSNMPPFIRNVAESFYWSDSTANLDCLKNEDKQFQVFVANRISLINDVTDVNRWHYVPTALNSADIGSRGLMPNETDKLKVWLEGPSFLREDESTWDFRPPPNANLESEIALLTVEPEIDEGNQFLCTFAERFSDLYRLERSAAWLFRFTEICVATRLRIVRKTPIVPPLKIPPPLTCPITLEDVRFAFSKILVAYQLKHRVLVNGQPNRNLIKLRPFLDERGVVRIQGRLRKATNIPYNARHPVVLPADSHLTTLVVRRCHIVNGHTPEAHTLALVRFQGFWVLRGKSSVKRVQKGCVFCIHMHRQPAEQLMADLPPSAAEGTYCFSDVGTDCMGPFQIKIGRKIYKRWVCNFTCRTFRAVHLEVLEMMDTSSFVLAARRFQARRGNPHRIISDVGTNYVGAANEIDLLLAEIDQDKLSEFAMKENFEWKFVSAKASHHMGFVERLNKSIRRTLYGLSTERVYDPEVFSTLICQVEQILNSRPLVPLSSNIDDLEPLTPAHLLLLRPNEFKPLLETSDHDLYTRKYYRKAENLAVQFRDRFIKEYVPTLQSRQKWHKEEPSIEVGTFVFVMDEERVRGKYPLARITEVFPDDDGRVRTVTIRDQNGLKSRPITKLIPIEKLT